MVNTRFGLFVGKPTGSELVLMGFMPHLPGNPIDVSKSHLCRDLFLTSSVSRSPSCAL